MCIRTISKRRKNKVNMLLAAGLLLVFPKNSIIKQNNITIAPKYIIISRLAIMITFDLIKTMACISTIRTTHKRVVIIEPVYMALTITIILSRLNVAKNSVKLFIIFFFSFIFSYGTLNIQNILVLNQLLAWLFIT